jgi:TonB family protein
MNAAPDSIAGPANTGGWSRKKLFLLFLAAIGIHFASVVAFGVKKNPPPREVGAVPHLQLAQNSLEITALTDPTLFVLPHEALDGVPAAWRKPPQPDEPSFHWAENEPPPFLKPLAEDFGANFAAFLKTNQMTRGSLDFKPAPQVAAPEAAVEPMLPQHSILKINGDLAVRPTPNLPVVPVIPCNDVIRPSRVQAVVDSDGNVISAVLLESSEFADADRKALELARQIQFAPTGSTAMGEFIFTWHTVPITQP